MMWHYFCSRSLLYSNKSCSRIFVRFRHKKKLVQNKKKKTASQYALDHFDNYYGQVYGDLWPSFRVSLLSQHKYAALVNMFADYEATIAQLHELETFDFIYHCRESFQNVNNLDVKEQAADLVEMQQSEDKELSEKSDEHTAALKSSESDLYDFMPVTTVISESRQMALTEVQQNIFEPVGNTKFEIVPFTELVLSKHLQVMVHERGHVQKFPPAKPDSTGKLGYYLMDAASILPVLALNLTPGCSVLDLCAAPGGKTLAMLQTMLPESMCCVDHSWSRIQRLKEVMRWYVPKSEDGDKIKILHGNGLHFSETTENSMNFDRVLVDVPCFTDRHVLHTDENNIFRPVRRADRLAIQQLQRDLLYAGIKSCRPGGYIVYSTCTLSMPQNDGIIQRTLDKLWQETNITVAIKDTRSFATGFKDIFNFYDQTRFGQLVVPNLTANFGPLYFCTLQRLS